MKRIVLTIAVLLVVSALLGLSSTLFADSSATAFLPAVFSQSDVALATTAIPFTPVADAFVSQAYPSANYGTSTQLRVDGSPIVRSYLRFSVSGLTAPVTKVTLRLYANSALSSGVSAYRVGSNTWGETTITYGNAPLPGSLIGSSAGSITAGTWVSIDVTSYVLGNGTYSLALASTNATALSLASREATNKPQLVITTGTAPSPTPSRTATPIPTATRVPPTATPVGTDYQPTFPIRAAFFYPWFPQAWTQQGIFPYTNYHPALGWYSSTDDAIIDQQLTLAARAHLQVFISSWWGQGHHTDTALQYILGRSERVGSPYPNMRWAIYYELESQGDPTVTQITSDLQYLASKAFNQPGYLKVNGKPVVFVYADSLDGCGMATRWAQAKQAVGGNVYVVLKVFAGYATCANQPDSWHQYSPAVDYDQQGTYSAVASPGFWLYGNPVRLVRDATRFESDVQKVVASGARWQLITTWNEWGEGTAVEPATEWGNTYVDILCRNLPGTVSCSGTAPTATPIAPSTPLPTVTPTPSGASDPVVVAVGDIACDPTSSLFNGGLGTSTNCRQKYTSDLALNLTPAAVLTLGDTQYEDGALSKFQGSYDPSWGRVKSITRPSVGNHEYLTSGAAGYYQYFGAAAGDPKKGYYSYDIGAWHLIVLNSECSYAGGCGAGSAQETWLKADLAAHPNKCTLAYWHEPRFSSGEHGNHTAYVPFWQDLYNARADIVLNGHDHDYERFGLQDPNAAATGNGIREFVVGTGGKNHYGFVTIQPNSQVRNADTYGVLKLTLHATSYDWKFVPESGQTFTDSGSEACR